MGLLMQVSALLAGINMVVLIALLSLYVRNMRKIMSSFTIGLALFATFLLVQNALSLFSYGMMYVHFDEVIEPYLVSINVAEAVGLLILYRTTSK